MMLSQQLAVWRERDSLDPARMALEGMQQRSRAGIPQLDCLVPRRRRQQLAVHFPILLL